MITKSAFNSARHLPRVKHKGLGPRRLSWRKEGSWQEGRDVGERCEQMRAGMGGGGGGGGGFSPWRERKGGPRGLTCDAEVRLQG